MKFDTNFSANLQNAKKPKYLYTEESSSFNEILVEIDPVFVDFHLEDDN